VLVTWHMCSKQDRLAAPSSTTHTTYRLIGNAIVPSNLSERVSPLKTIEDRGPLRRGYLPMRIMDS
jgi:hypothetical protein